MVGRILVASLWAALAVAIPVIREQNDNFQSTGPIRTLLPAVHWAHNAENLTHLIPKYENSLYYSDSGVAHPAVPHQFGHMHTTLSYPSVVLEHSNYVGKVSCSEDGMIIPFTRNSAYEVARYSWSLSGGFSIVSHTVGCGADRRGQRFYWKVQKVLFDDQAKTASVQAQEIELEEALHGAHLQYGMYQPPTQQRNRHSKIPEPRLRRQGLNTSTSCGSPLAPTIGGLPATSCGSGFDQRLDSSLGYLDFGLDFSSSMKSIAPNLDDYNEDDYDLSNLPDDETSLEHLSKRRHIGFHINKKHPETSIKISHAIHKRRKVLISSLENVAEEVARAIKDAVNKAEQFVVDLTHKQFGPSLYANMDIQAVPANLTKSPFSKAKTDKEIYKSEKKFEGGEAALGVYCVNCGIRGSIHVYGEVFFTLADGLTSANINMDGNLLGRAVIGLDAHIKYEYKKKKGIFETGLPGFSIPKIITVGPVVKLDAKFGFNFDAKAQLQAGIELGIPNFQARLDLIDSSKSGSSGFEPQVKPIFIASGQIKASTSFSTPLSLGIGVIMPLIDFDKTVSLTEEPGIVASAEYSTEDPNCLKYSIGFENKLYADFFGVSTFDLFGPTKADIVPATCYQLIKRDFPGIEDTIPAREHLALDTRQDDGGDGETEPYDTSNPDNEEFQELNAEALQQAEAIQNGTGDKQDFGFTYIPIYDASGQYLLANDDDGTFRVAPTNSTTGGVVWQQYGSYITSDSEERIIHYHKNEMNTYGVSRLRLAEFDAVPKDAMALQLMPTVDDSDGNAVLPSENFYVAADTEGNYFFLVTCIYKNLQPSRVFLVKDLVEGLTTLANPDLRFTITGGVVDQCLFQGFLAQTSQ